MWDRMSVPQSHCARRALYQGSGTGMGGSGSVNGMVYTRGSREDYAEWPNGWNWDDIQDDFRAIEKALRQGLSAALPNTARRFGVTPCWVPERPNVHLEETRLDCLW